MLLDGAFQGTVILHWKSKNIQNKSEGLVWKDFVKETEELVMQGGEFLFCVLG